MFVNALAVTALQSKAFDRQCKSFDKIIHLM